MSESGDYEEVVRAQLASLDDTDAYASAWADALSAAAAANEKVSWGGRGKGGRGLARRTFQPHDIVVDDVCLEYINDARVTGAGGGGSKQLLDGASLKLLSGHVYSLVGRNGSGKSTLLKRVAAGKIPGFPPHRATMLVSQELFGYDGRNALDVVLESHRTMKETSAKSNAARITELEAQLDALDMESEDDQAKVETICEEISELEEESNENDDNSGEERARDALRFWGIPEDLFSTPTAKLSGGVRKQVELACALFSRPDLLLLDEPTNFLDIRSLLCLRGMIWDFLESNAIVVLVSHDIDLINDVVTDTIHLHELKLSYFPGNYRDYLGYRKQGITHELRQANALERQRTSMVKTIDNLKKKAASSSSKKKIGKTIESRKKKLERHGVEKDEHGHRWTAQKASTGIRPGAINSVDASTRSHLTHKQLLKRAEVDIGPVPDKAVQFDFRDTTSSWGDEPLVMAMDVGYGYDKGLIFDCVELCIRERSRSFILGENGSGKSSLLSILAGQVAPLEGTVHVASGLSIGYFHQHVADDLIATARKVTTSGEQVVTPLSLLTELYPKKNEQDLRGELTSFGLNPKQASTNVRFLSGGERCRLCMAAMMLKDPQLLILDEISNHLDVESVEAIIYGIKKWNGTVIMASHDTNLIRSIGGDCYVLLESEGKLRRVVGGIDAYLKAFR
uniref:ABC transporter domain-containing protein n=1 Tax=Odontella aurita TaxID=265563 RepID=A0A7S4N6T8_9STRA|mmetsp:Transcript_50746/g.152829  ORF Transcript_50746/g.152829 Transcript_50746/m.152829 type:complete len:682 (+) Transcript_50746:101-2146(+)